MTKFTDLGLDPKVLKAVSEAGYETPTPIQAGAIPHALQGRDVLGIAQTGTGKTASFVLPMITLLSKGRARARMPRSLVLCPTRELAAQVAENFEAYAKHTKLSMALLIGGVSFKDQDRLIDRGVDVLIATPGRLLDHFERGKLMLTGVQIMVVDEADRMLDMGFIPDIERIFKLTPFTRQTLFFSATMAPEITRVTNEFLSNPKRVEVARQATTSETITQAVCMLKPSRKDRGPKEKRDLLRAIIADEGDSLTNAIIFCNRKRDVDIVAKSLRKYGLDASPLHGDLDQSLRMKILNSFRDGDLRLLVASDVAARGLDIPNVSHVFNFDVPIHSEDYVHRIGRTGRAGRAGKAFTLCMPFEEKYLAAIEGLVKKEIPRVDAPGAAAKPQADVPKAEEKPAEPRRKQEPRRKPAEQPKQEQEQRQRTAEKPKQEPRRREERPAQNNRRGGRRDNGPRVVGMGDHMPAFMTIDLSAALEDAGKEVIEDEVVVEEVTVEVEVAEEKPAKKPRRSRAKKKVEEAVEVVENTETAPVETPEAVSETPEAEPAVAEEVVKEKPKRVSKPRKPRVKKKVEAPEAKVEALKPETTEE